MLWKPTLILRYVGLTQIPMILFARPKVIKLNASQCVVSIPFRRRTKNHLKSLYIGALVIGADLAGGLLVLEGMRSTKHKISLVFKDMNADFLKRVDARAIFTCRDGEKVRALIEKVVSTGERHHELIHVAVTAPDKYGDEVLANFSMTLSLKVKS